MKFTILASCAIVYFRKISDSCNRSLLSIVIRVKTTRKEGIQVDRELAPGMDQKCDLIIPDRSGEKITFIAKDP